MDYRQCVVVGLVAMTACGAVERGEAIRLAAELEAERVAMARVDSLENEMLTSYGPWLEHLASAGACDPRRPAGESFGGESAGGRHQDAVTAEAYLSRFDFLSQDLQQRRLRLASIRLSEAATQQTRDEVVAQLESRLRFLNGGLDHLRVVALDAGSISNCTGAVPQEAPELRRSLQAYGRPYDELAKAIASLRARYKFTDDDMRRVRL